MNDELFWLRVNARLDAREDPLADTDVAAGIADEPRRAAELVRLLDRLDLVATPAAPLRRPRRLAATVAAAALLLASAAAIAVAWHRSSRSDVSRPRDESPPHVAVIPDAPDEGAVRSEPDAAAAPSASTASAPRGAILDWSIRVTREVGGTVQVHELRRDDRRAGTVETAWFQPPPSRRAGADRPGILAAGIAASRVRAAPGPSP